MRIEICELSKNGHKRVSEHATNDPAEAKSAAIKKHFGDRAGWWPDSGLGPDYGQVIVRVGPGDCYNCLTDRVRILEVSHD